MGLNDQIENGLEALEALYYLTQGLAGEGGARLSRARRLLPRLSRTERQQALATLKKDITAVRHHYGALASNQLYKQILANGRTAPTGLLYISKLLLEQRLFSRYERAIVRWPHIKLHAFVVFDPQSGWMNQVFELDGQLFHDAQFLLGKARKLHGTVRRQRQLPLARHRVLHSLLRPFVTTLFTFMEAYLNGIAFDCFQKQHDALALADHDLLAEWDSERKRRRFVSFDQKVFKYPVVVAKSLGRHLDLSGFQHAHRIVLYGKEIRDAITHPSAHFDPVSREQKKMELFASLTLPAMESIYKDVFEYVQYVENALGNDPTQSATWLFDDYGFVLAKDEAL
jgi:hypothetical protein